MKTIIICLLIICSAIILNVLTHEETKKMIALQCDQKGIKSKKPSFILLETRKESKG